MIRYMQPIHTLFGGMMLFVLWGNRWHFIRACTIFDVAPKHLTKDCCVVCPD